MMTSDAPRSRKQRSYPKLWGYSVTRICYRLGQLGWDKVAAQNALETLLKCEIEPSTISTAISDGSNPRYEKGNAAPLTDQQISQLTHAASDQSSGFAASFHLETVENVLEVRENIRRFQSDLLDHSERGLRLARQTTYWVFDPETDAFGPSSPLN